MNKEFSIKCIGVVHSKLTQKDECPLQEAEGAPDALIEIFPDFRTALDGISAASRLILFTWLHQADRTILKCHPRDEIYTPQLGVFATRSPDRPNPIGIHHVEVVEVCRPGWIKVYPLEVIDGTPVVDIKPFLGSDRWKSGVDE